MLSQVMCRQFRASREVAQEDCRGCHGTAGEVQAKQAAQARNSCICATWRRPPQESQAQRMPPCRPGAARSGGAPMTRLCG